MIKKFIDKLFGKSASPASGAQRSKKSVFGERREVGPQDHAINPKLVDDRAMDVVHTLKQAGYEAYIVGGAVIVETVFQYPGIGQQLVQAVQARDIPTVQAIALLVGVAYIVINVVADVVALLLVPRLRTAL